MVSEWAIRPQTYFFHLHVSDNDAHVACAHYLDYIADRQLSENFFYK